MNRIFLLSPANPGGERARMLLNERADFPLREIFSFISGLYFRGKLAYGETFAAPEGLSGVLVIAAGRRTPAAHSSGHAARPV